MFSCGINPLEKQKKEEGVDDITGVIKAVINEGITASNGFQKRMGFKCMVVFTWLALLTVFDGLLVWWFVQ